MTTTQRTERLHRAITALAALHDDELLDVLAWLAAELHRLNRSA
jgi:hypothetical protein